MSTIPAYAFAEKYGITQKKLTAFLAHKPSFRIQRKGMSAYVREREIVLRKELQYLVWHCATTMYYVMMDIFETEERFAEALAITIGGKSRKWKAYISEDLFYPLEEDVLSLRISARHVKIINFGLFVIDYIKKRENEIAPVRAKRAFSEESLLRDGHVAVA